MYSQKQPTGIFKKTEMLVALIFFIPGLFWIAFGERILLSTGTELTPEELEKIEIYQQVFFVTLFSIAIFLAIKILKKRVFRSEQQYKSLFESNPSPMWIFDKDTLRFLTVNLAAVAHYGYSKEEFLCMTIRDIRTEDESSLLEQTLGNLQGRLKNTEIWKHKKKNGEIISVQITAENTIFNKKDCRLILANDVTEWLKAKQDLEKSVEKAISNEALMNNAEEMAHFGSWEVNLTNGATHWSDEAYRIYGYTPDDTGPSYDFLLNHIHPDDLVHIKKTIDEAVAHLDSQKMNFMIIDKMGRLKYIQSELKIERSNENVPTRIVGFSLDVTEAKLAEEELKQSHETLRRLAAHLQDVREEERISMAREIHDELGQMLTVLKIDIAMMLPKVSKEQEIRKGINSAMHMTDDIIGIVRKIATQLRPALLDDMGLVAALEWQCREFEKRSGVRCSFSETGHCREMEKSVATGLFRIYQETLTNVTRHADATQVHASIIHEDEYLTLVITDNGKGFDPVKAKEKNHLGLVGIAERALLMNGELNIQSAPGTGTTVTIKVKL